MNRHYRHYGGAAAFFAGVTGSLAISAASAILRRAGMSSFSLEIILGKLLTQATDQASFNIGFVWHLLNGGVFGLVYAGVFKWINAARPSAGAVLGLAHWLLA